MQPHQTAKLQGHYSHDNLSFIGVLKTPLRVVYCGKAECAWSGPVLSPYVGCARKPAPNLPLLCRICYCTSISFQCNTIQLLQILHSKCCEVQLRTQVSLFFENFKNKIKIKLGIHLLIGQQPELTDFQLDQSQILTILWRFTRMCCTWVHLMCIVTDHCHTHDETCQWCGSCSPNSVPLKQPHTSSSNVEVRHMKLCIVCQTMMSDLLKIQLTKDEVPRAKFVNTITCHSSSNKKMVKVGSWDCPWKERKRSWSTS